MAEEKSAPKKEKPIKAAAAPVEGAAVPPAEDSAKAGPAGEKKARASKAAGEKGGKSPAEGGAPAAAGAPGTAGGDGAAKGPSGEPKPVELVHGVAKQPTAEDLLKEELGAVKVRKAKGSKNVTSGYANVLASFNNTIVSITDQKGAVIAWSSAGKCNFRGSRKSTAYAAQIVAQDAARNAMAHGLKDIQIRVSGPGLGRDSAIRALQAIGLEITSIVDVTPIPHNGCRPRKRRRV
jgi:small subunit ribosomal protein S11